MSGPIPVTIVTGFLGAGKTTLLAGLIRRRQTRRLALLINEFGEVAVDGALIREAVSGIGGAAQVRIAELPHGLIAYGDDEQFLPAMQAIAARRANIDHVLIETSGLALPSAVMEWLQTPALAADFVLDATLAVVDTPLLLEASKAGAHADADASAAWLFEQQLALADVVVLNKIDALDETALLRAETLIRARAPNVRFLELAYHAQLDIRLALGLRLHQSTRGAEHAHNRVYTPVARMPGADAQPLPDQGFLNGHAHSGMGAHSHGLTTHKHFHEQDPGWLSFTLRSDAAQALPQLTQALAEAARQEPILRSKGFVRAGGARSPVLVQGVRARITLAESAAADADPADRAAQTPSSQRSELVFIGYHANRKRVADLLSAITATHWS
ncbi:MAG: cobalamin biosynthesis protein [Herbaspirillum sp.]|jgi:cobalamin biosynthesis protein CobW|nr:cobalamin biosynthesis protein [Herbaspirillum sp.]